MWGSGYPGAFVSESGDCRAGGEGIFKVSKDADSRGVIDTVIKCVTEFGHKFTLCPAPSCRPDSDSEVCFHVRKSKNRTSRLSRVEGKGYTGMVVVLVSGRN